MRFKERLEGKLVQILFVDIPYAGKPVRRGRIGVILGVEDNENRFAVMLMEGGNIWNERAVALKRFSVCQAPIRPLDKPDQGQTAFASIVSIQAGRQGQILQRSLQLIAESLCAYGFPRGSKAVVP